MENTQKERRVVFETGEGQSAYITLCNDEHTELAQYSFSKVSTFHTCPFEWFQTYVNHVEGDSNDMANYGSYSHEKIEQILSGDKLPIEVMEDISLNFDNAFPKGISINFGGFSRDLTNGYYESLVNYINTFDYLGGLKVLDIEKKFKLCVSVIDTKTIENNIEFVFTGIADCIAQDANGDYYVVDLKSKGKFKNKAELQQYARQLYLYSLYVYLTYGKWPKELWFEQFRIGSRVKIDFKSEGETEAIDWLIHSIIEISNTLSFDPHVDSFYCNNLCPLRNKDICKAG